MAAKEEQKAVAALEHDGKVRLRVGGITNHMRKKAEWYAEARAFLEHQVAMMSRFAWDDDAQAGRDAGTLVLLATKNEPFGQSLNGYAEMIECPEGILVETSTSHRSKGREWDHVILLDGIATEYLASHPGDPAKMDMMGQV